MIAAVSTGQGLLILFLIASLAGGGVWSVLNGRFRSSRPGPGAASAGVAEGGVLAGTPYADQLGERATLVQFSSAFCAPCRAARVVLAQVADAVPGVRHVEIDAEQHLDLVRRTRVMRTPTTVVLDAEGRERGRASGAPSREQVLAALEFLP